MNLLMENGREQFYRWDTGQRLIVEDDSLCRQVHFAHSDADLALVCVIREQDGVRVVDVPNDLLQQAGQFKAYLFHYADDGALTLHTNSFEVLDRPKPDTYVYTQTEALNYTHLDERIKVLEETGADPETIGAGVESYLREHPITAAGIGALPADQLPEAIRDALAEAKQSGEFDGADGYTPVKGTDYFTEADKQEIAEQAANLVEIPSGGGSAYTDTVILDTELTEEVSEVSVVLTDEMKDAILNADFVFASAYMTPATGTTATGGLYFGVSGNYYTQLNIETSGNNRVANSVPYEGSGKTGYTERVLIRETSCADKADETVFLRLGHSYNMSASVFSSLRVTFTKIGYEQKLRIHTDTAFGIGSKFKFIARRLNA